MITNDIQRSDHNETQNGEYLSEREAAREIGVSHLTLFRKRHKGEIAHFRIGARVIYSRAQISDFLKRCEKQAVESERAK